MYGEIYNEERWLSEEMPEDCVKSSGNGSISASATMKKRFASVSSCINILPKP
ncbi:unknown [Ruminococcus sp. CAG:382]|nr:unknown [Ruminococcus sp. CAG:382]